VGEDAGVDAGEERTMSNEQRDEAIRARVLAGERQAEIAREMGVSPQRIGQIVHERPGEPRRPYRPVNPIRLQEFAALVDIEELPLTRRWDLEFRSVVAGDLGITERQVRTALHALRAQRGIRFPGGRGRRSER
jgi:transposase-like protein